MSLSKTLKTAIYVFNYDNMKSQTCNLRKTNY